MLNDMSVKPFSVAERLAAISRILANLESNPRFNLFLTKNDDVLLSENPVNIIAYGNRLMYISPVLPSTGWSAVASEKNPTIQIQDEDFIAAFKDFFNDELLRHTLSKDETIQYLSDMIRKLASQLKH